MLGNDCIIIMNVLVSYYNVVIYQLLMVDVYGYPVGKRTVAMGYSIT